MKLKQYLGGLSISENTLKAEDLITAGLEFLEGLGRIHFIMPHSMQDFDEFKEKISSYRKEFDDFDTLNYESDLCDLWESITCLFEEIQPEFTSFGSHPGNGSDIGFHYEDYIYCFIQELEKTGIFFKPEYEKQMTFNEKLEKCKEIEKYLSSEKSITSGWNIEPFSGDLQDLSENYLIECSYGIMDEYIFQEKESLIAYFKESGIEVPSEEELEKQAEHDFKSRVFIYPISCHSEIIFHEK